MLIAKQQGTDIIVLDHKVMFPDTSFSSSGPDKTFMAENECMHVNLWKSFDSETEELIQSSPYIEDGEVFTVVVVNKQQQPETVL